MHGLRGAFVPLLTPFVGTTVDFESLARLVDHVLVGGADGLWLCGTSGEFYGLSGAERNEIIAHVATHVDGRVPVIAQVGEAATARTVALGHAARDAGVDALAVVNPYYLEWSQEELCEHLRTVVRETGDPVLAYQHPASLPNALTTSSILALASQKVLCGIKDSAPDLTGFEELLAALGREGSDLACFHGAGATAHQTLEAGASGFVSIISNLLPRHCSELACCVREGRSETARVLQGEMNELADSLRAALPSRTTWAPVIGAYKHVLGELGVLATADVAAPLEPLRPEERAHLTAHAVPLADRLYSSETISEELG